MFECKSNGTYRTSIRRTLQSNVNYQRYRCLEMQLASTWATLRSGDRDEFSIVKIKVSAMWFRHTKKRQCTIYVLVTYHF